jgi:hypothetical protein
VHAFHAPQATALIHQALVPYERKPEAGEIARLTDGLLTLGAGLLAAAEALRETDGRVGGALRDWRQLTETGPTVSPLGNWDHARALARTVRTLHEAVGGRHQEVPYAHLVPLSFGFGRCPM